MHSSIAVVKPALDIGLISLYEAKVSLGIPTSSTDQDELLRFIINRASDEVQTLCSRVFPKEEVIETFREINNPITRLPLSRYPVQLDDISSIVIDGTDTVYDLDSETGILTLYAGNFWAETVVVSYSGGYEIPQGVPPALRQATLLFTKEIYYSAQRGDTSIRQVAHKESRIIYFDPATMIKAMNTGGSGGGGGGSAAQNAAKNLLQRYTRLTA
jgi:hypothetical protein